MARVVAIAADLLLGSRVQEGLRGAGHDVSVAPTLAEAPLEGAEALIADLDVESPDALVGLGMPVLGYYSHVDTATRQAAEAAGVDLVVPRSRMARELPALIEKLLGE